MCLCMNCTKSVYYKLTIFMQEKEDNILLIDREEIQLVFHAHNKINQLHGSFNVIESIVDK